MEPGNQAFIFLSTIQNMGIEAKEMVMSWCFNRDLSNHQFMGDLHCKKLAFRGDLIWFNADVGIMSDFRYQFSIYRSLDFWDHWDH